jgi:putative cell wall-binding protein|tara:strand:- start:19751 stop:20452 length:702 start_codon:yes stop_codon:yes gene_type:complete
MKKLAEQYYFNGYLTGKINPSPLYLKYISALYDIYNKKLKKGFFLKEKYPHSVDLRPEAYEYDDSIMDILFENNIPQLLNNVVGENLVLSHVQIRIAYPFQSPIRSYMPWHRDTHWYNGQLHGNAPPIHKIIYYPKFESESESVLQVLPKSHLKIFEDSQKDYEQLNNQDMIQTIKSSNHEYLLFNTSMFHSTLPVREKAGNLRVVYNFVREFQLDNYKDKIPCQNRWRKWKD